MSLTALILVALVQLPPSADPKPIPITGTVVDGSGAAGGLCRRLAGRGARSR